MRDYGVVRTPPRIEECPYFGRNSQTRYSRKVRVWKKTGGYCTYCGCELDFMRDFDVDHIVPKSRGGSNKIENLTPSCVACNCGKGNRSAEHFIKLKGFSL